MHIITDLIAILLAVTANPIAVIYVNMAMVHLVAMQCYRVHKDGDALAHCAGLASVLYFLLALIHAAGH